MNDLKRARAAMRRDFEAIWEEVSRAPGPDLTDLERDQVQARRIALLKEFLQRHAETLEASGGTAAAGFPDVHTLLLALKTSESELEQAIEAYLQKQADLAERLRELSVTQLRLLQTLEGLSSEAWEAMSETERKQAYEALEELRELRPGLLEDLPIDLRREFESED